MILPTKDGLIQEEQRMAIRARPVQRLKERCAIL